MTFLRLLFIAGVIWLLYRLARKLFVKTDTDSRKSLETTHMVRCAYCNVYTTKQDAYLKEDNYFCSSDHYEKHIRKESK
jgi:formylmethanofuran dehydrogenase subunit E